MKWLIASDLHGSSYYCALLLKALERESADRLLFLGDILYHGPRNELPQGYAPKEVITMLNGIKDSMLCVKGNCDSDVDQMVLEFPIMAEYSLIPIGKNNLIFATHGDKYNMNNMPPIKKGDIILSGHTHVPSYTSGVGCHFINPGSLSLPKEGSCNSYITFEDAVFTWKEIDGTLFKEFVYK